MGEDTFTEVEGDFPILPGPAVVLRGRVQHTVSYEVKWWEA
jgi:hypothetical protein